MTLCVAVRHLEFQVFDGFDEPGSEVGELQLVAYVTQLGSTTQPVRRASARGDGERDLLRG